MSGQIQTPCAASGARKARTTRATREARCTPVPENSPSAGIRLGRKTNRPPTRKLSLRFSTSVRRRRRTFAAPQSARKCLRRLLHPPLGCPSDVRVVPDREAGTAQPGGGTRYTSAGHGNREQEAFSSVCSRCGGLLLLPGTRVTVRRGFCSSHERSRRPCRIRVWWSRRSRR